MGRQHSVPILIPIDGMKAFALPPFVQQSGRDGVSEDYIQMLIHENPNCLPIGEIDPMFSNPVPICRELNTPAGPIDNFMVTPSGLPVLVECKLWRNPEGRREVVGQILDYAKELTRWSSSDLQREVKSRLKTAGNPLLKLIRDVSPEIDEVTFNDALTFNLRRGRFLLLIVGDGIREGVEAITEYLQLHAGLHFSFGLIEFPIYLMPDGGRLVAPRVLAKTTIVTRTVVAVPEGYLIEEAQDPNSSTRDDPDGAALADEQQRFWSEFLTGFKLDDPEQVIPRSPRQGFIAFMMPAPSGSCWLTAYRDIKRNEVGVFLSFHRNTAGAFACDVIADNWGEVRAQLGGTTRMTIEKDGRRRIVDSKRVISLTTPETRRLAFTWLAERVNTFVNVLRPRVRSAVADYPSDIG